MQGHVSTPQPATAPPQPPQQPAGAGIHCSAAQTACREGRVVGQIEVLQLCEVQQGSKRELARQVVACRTGRDRSNETELRAVQTLGMCSHLDNPSSCSYNPFPCTGLLVSITAHVELQQLPSLVANVHAEGAQVAAISFLILQRGQGQAGIVRAYDSKAVAV